MRYALSGTNEAYVLPDSGVRERARPAGDPARSTGEEGRSTKGVLSASPVVRVGISNNSNMMIRVGR